MKSLNYIVIVILFYSCRKPYDPPAISSPGSYLVVEGVITSGSDSTIIKLSRTVNIGAQSVVNPVSGATVMVVSNQNVDYPLMQTAPGTYSSPGLNLNNAQQYRLSIVTNNEQYLSDFVAVLNSPPIDSVGFTITGSGLNIYSNTHDPTNMVQYYRWDYQETWIYHSPIASAYVSNGDTVLLRTRAQEVSQCWQSDTSSTITVNSSAKLSRAVITNNPITAIASTSEKIEDEYSILVRQYALTADAYTFWQNLKQNTEQLGSIFDPQPSQINGNIHSVTHPNEPVIGYISAGAVTTKRIFIRNQQLPNWPVLPPDPPCVLDTLYYQATVTGVSGFVNQVNEFINYNKGAFDVQIPVAGVGPRGKPPIGYSASTPDCVDCTVQHGTNVEPAFWIY